MWLIATYQPTSLFSLKDSRATNSGGKSLLCPSPYTVKMALFDLTMKYYGKEKLTKVFQDIKDMEIHFRMSNNIVTNNCFVKIQKEPHSETKKKNPTLTFQPTVAFREYLFLDSPIKIAMKLSGDAKDNGFDDFLGNLLRRISYFGKRGCFFQFLSHNQVDDLPLDFSRTSGKGSPLFMANQILDLDDFDEKAKWENANIYSKEKSGRIQKRYILPYRRAKSNRNFTLWTIDAERFE